MAEKAIRLADLATNTELPADLDDSRICYWRAGPEWWIYLPRGGSGRLTAHSVQEHEDGTITVSPSILLTSTRPDRLRRRHGFLRRGEWEACCDDLTLEAPTDGR